MNKETAAGIVNAPDMEYCNFIDGLVSLDGTFTIEQIEAVLSILKDKALT